MLIDENVSGPLTPAEYGNARSIGAQPIDVGAGRADHPVDVNQALVAALRRDLLRGQLRTIHKALRVALTKRDMGSGILVEQGVKEQ